MQLAQVLQGSLGGFKYIPASVVPPVLLQAQFPAGSRDDLPESCRPAPGVCKRVICTLDNRQERQVQRHAGLLQGFDDVMEVPLGTPQHKIQIVRIGDIPVEFAVDRRM